MKVLAERDRCGWITAVAVAGLLLTTACGEKPVPEPPPNESVIRAFGMCSATPAPPPQPPQVEFWLDDSMSMAGYVGVPSAYQHVLRKMIEGAVNAGYPSTIRGLSAPAAVPLESMAAIMQPKYYSAVDTRLGAVLDEIGQPKQKGEPDKIVVLVSDLIQDEASRDSLIIAASLRKVAVRYPNVVLYGFRSAYRGTYYITAPPRGKTYVDTIDGVGRPFYVLVMAPSIESMRQFQKFAGLFEMMSKKDYAPHAFEPSVPPVTVGAANLKNELDPSKVEWEGFGTPVSWDCAIGRRSQILSLHSTPIAHQGPVTLDFDLQATPVLPLVIPGRYQADVRRLMPDASGTEPAPEVTVTADGQPADASCILHVKIPPPAVGRWQTYSIRMRAGDANLMTPKWIGEWSTESDVPQESRDKTLNLTTFGDALVRAMAEQTVFLEQVIEVYRGE